MDIVAVVADDVDERTVASVQRCHPDLVVLQGSWPQPGCHVLVVAAGAELPVDALLPALAMVDDDPRIGTVSFWCHDAGFLHLPHALDPDAATRRLRETSPDLLPSPIPFAAGPAVLLSAACLSAVGPLGAGPLDASLIDFSLRGRRRGFFAVVDPSTFCHRLGPASARVVGETEQVLVEEYTSPSSPLSVVRGAARAKVAGLRVLVDAARLGPREMGTQVATVALITALARRDDVAQVCVALAEELPPYAGSLRDDPKVDARVTVDRDFSVFGRVDVAHRPFQPDSPSDMDACRAVADRVVITVLDLIAYHAVSYQLAPENWKTYRDWTRQSIAQADGVIAPTHDVCHQILLERLPVDPDRLLVAELGTDHLRGDEPESRPADVASGADFILVLGADYTHKNRDLAVRAHRELGPDLLLVMAGTRVHGSSRALEDEARAPDQHIVDLPDVSSEERNWLLRRASVVLYPTSGEGFGLVPFEAAAFGTPTAFVSFGPLAELAGDLPVQAADWSPVALADAVARLLADPSLAQAQIGATLAAGTRYTWDASAAKLVDIYRTLLAQPPRVVPVPPSPPEPPHEDDERSSTAFKMANRALQVLRRSPAPTRLKP